MKELFSWLKPAPHIPEIQDQEAVKESYNYWRIRIFYSTFIGYALYYFTRKSFTFAMPSMMMDLGFDKTQLGILASVFSITYGISKFASGVFSDRSNPRYFMAIGLFLTGVVNIMFGMASSISLFILLWGLNGWFQGFGWPPCSRFLTQWYSHSERGSWWSSWNVSHNVGAFLIPLIVGVCVTLGSWRIAMFIPGLICILGSLFLINRLRDTPQSLGLPAVEKFRNDYSAGKVLDDDGEMTTKEILVEYVLKNKWLWLLSISYFFVYFVRTGVNDWTALYLQEAKGYSPMVASSCVSMFEIGGIAGSLVAGWSSDYLFGARRGPVNVIFTVAMLLSIILFWCIPGGYPLLDTTAIFLIGFAIFGPQMLIGMAAAELVPKKAAASSNGFAGFFSYMGAAVAGYPLGVITQEYGWEGFFWATGLCCLISTLFLLPLWNVTKSTRKAVAQTA